MQKQRNVLDFQGQPFYVGLDVHLKNWSVTISTDQLKLKTFSMDPDPGQLQTHLNRNYPGGRYFSVYEAGFTGFWIHRALHELGIDNIVINPADVPTTHKEKQRRSDPVDSSKLSRELANHSLRPIYVPDPFHEELRSLCRLYHLCVTHQSRLKNRIRSFLHRHNIRLPERSESYPWSGRFMAWLESLVLDEEAAQANLRYCLDELQSELNRVKDILKTLREISRRPPIKAVVHDYLMSVPGVGFITAITFYSEIVDMNRFSTFDQLASYVGLVPDTDASGEREATTGLTFRQNKLLRTLLIEAAWLAVRFDPALTQKFSELAKRMKKQQAIIRIAKKLLSRMRHVWLHETEYVKSLVCTN